MSDTNSIEERAEEIAIEWAERRTRVRPLTSAIASLCRAVERETESSLRARLAEEERERDALQQRVSYYENTLCAKPARPISLPPYGEVVTGYISTEKVGDVLRERDAAREALRLLIAHHEGRYGSPCGCGLCCKALAALSPSPEAKP